MKKILEKLFQHQPLTKEESYDILTRISNADFNHSQIAAFVTVYLMRGITVDELGGFRDALLQLAIPFDVAGQDTIDLCGTGGDGKDTFNISTLASFVVAGAKYKVVKHGNYGVSSVSGSSNVMEHHGYIFTNNSSVLLKQLDSANICFFHAPLFHPALKGVAPIRRELGIKTFFNMLGPLVNPAQPNHQLVGVFNLKLARLYQFLYEKTDKSYNIIYGLDGYDEVSLTSDTLMIRPDGEHMVSPAHFGLQTLTDRDIHGGATVEAAAQIFIKILIGEGTTAQNAVVIANAAAAISCFKPSSSWESNVAEARQSLDSGAALRAFKTLLTNQ